MRGGTTNEEIETLNIVGVAYQPVPSDRAKTHVDTNLLRRPDRALWHDAGIKYSIDEINRDDWIGIPIRDTHGEVDVGKVVEAYISENGDLKINALLTSGTVAGAKALREMHEGKFFGFSVRYNYLVDHNTGQVRYKGKPIEVSLCKEPFFKECLIQVCASADTTNRENTSQRQPSLFRILPMSNQSGQQEQSQAPAAVPEQTAVEPTTAAAPAATTTETNNVQKEEQKPAEQQQEAASTIENPDLARLAKELEKAVQREKALAERLAHTNKINDALMLKAREESDEWLNPALLAMQETTGSPVPEELERYLRHISVKPESAPWLKQFSMATVEASKKAKEHEALIAKNAGHMQREMSMSQGVNNVLSQVQASRMNDPVLQNSEKFVSGMLEPEEDEMFRPLISPTEESLIQQSMQKFHQQIFQAPAAPAARMQTVAASATKTAAPATPNAGSHLSPGDMVRMARQSKNRDAAIAKMLPNAL